MTDKIRVLIADDVEETRETIARLLSFEEDIQVVGMAADGQEAVTMTRRLLPDCVLMDINMPGLDGLTATQLISVEAPQTVIIMMSVQGEQEYLRKAMLAGARDYLVKPFVGDELVNAIKRAYTLEQRRSSPAGQPKAKGRMLTIFSAKGGVGKSTLSVNLAVSLARKGRRTVLVDLDLQFGDGAVMLDINPARTISDLAAEVREFSLENILPYLEEHKSGLFLLAAPLRPEEGELVPSEAVGQILTALREGFEYVIVDTAQGFTEAALKSMDLGTELLVVSTLDLPTIKNTRLSMDIIDSLGYEWDGVRVVFNRCSPDSDLTPQMVAEKLPFPVAAWLPTDERAALRAANRGEPLVLGGKGKLAQGIGQLTELIDRGEARENAGPRPVLSGLKRLLNPVGG